MPLTHNAKVRNVKHRHGDLLIIITSLAETADSNLGGGSVLHWTSSKPGEKEGMEVHVMVKYSFYRKYLTDREYDKIALKEGATIRQVVDQLGVSEYYLSRITVNGEERGLDFVLSDADSIVIWPPRIGGG